MHIVLQLHKDFVDKRVFLHFEGFLQLFHKVLRLKLDRFLFFYLGLKSLIASNKRSVPNASEFAVYSGVSKLTLT